MPCYGFRKKYGVRLIVPTIAVFFSLLLPLTGCGELREVRKQVTANNQEANEALKKIEPSKERRMPLIVDSTPWYGSTAIPIQSGFPLPDRLMRNDGIVLTFDRPLDVEQIARMIHAATHIRTVVEKVSGNASNEEDQTLFLPVGGREVTGGRILWQGPLAELLDQVADSFEAEWKYDGRMIQITKEVTKTFMLHALSHSIQSSESLSGDGGSGLPSVATSGSVEVKIWGELDKTVGEMLGRKGRYSVSPSTGTITVSGPPQMVKRVENYLRQQNKMRLRRVVVGIKVLSVATSNANDVTFNLSGILKRAFDGKPLQFTAVGDGLTAGILRTLPTVDPVTGIALASDGAVTPDVDTLSTILQTSEDVDRVSLVHSGAVVTLSDIPAPLQIGRKIAFLERISSTSADESGNVSLEPGELTVGLSMNVLPRVIQKDRVLLRAAIGITDAQQPFQTFSAGGLSIQLPEIETTGFLQNAVLGTGETLVLAGFERNQAAVRDNGVPGGLLTGGVRVFGRSREVTVLLITAEILPEDPMTIIDSQTGD